MNKKTILSIFGGVFIIVVLIVLITNLTNNLSEVKELNQGKLHEGIHLDNGENGAGVAENLKETTSENDENLDTGKQEAVTFGVIQVPKICGPRERLDPKSNTCKRNI